MAFLPRLTRVQQFLSFSCTKAIGSTLRGGAQLILSKSITTSIHTTTSRMNRNIRNQSKLISTSFHKTTNYALTTINNNVNINIFSRTSTSTNVNHHNSPSTISNRFGLIPTNSKNSHHGQHTLFLSKRFQAASAATTDSNSNTPTPNPNSSNPSTNRKNKALTLSDSTTSTLQPIGKKHPKKSKKSKQRLFSYHAYAIPKPNHLKKGKFGKNDTEFGFAGEDAYFAKLIKTTDSIENVNSYDKFDMLKTYKSLVIGVADGVGNRRESQQLRSAHFAQELMQESLMFLNEIELDSQKIRDCLHAFDNKLNDDDNIDNIIYKYSYGDFETQLDGISQGCMKHSMNSVINSGFKGASTLCTVTLEFPQISDIADTRYDPKLLHACNLGDSGFAIFRRGMGNFRNDLEYINTVAHRSEGLDMDHSDDIHKLNQHEDGVGLDIVESELKTEDDMFEQEISFGEKIRKAFEGDYEGPRVGMPNLKPDTDYYMLYRSPTQIRDFGVPYQFGSHSTSNKITDAVNINGIELESGDIIVIGTDGLWDNLFSNEIANIVSDAIHTFESQYSASKKKKDKTNSIHRFILDGKITHRLMRQAYENSQDKSGVTPWSLYMTDTVEMIYSGGKHDDITCAVIYVH